MPSLPMTSGCTVASDWTASTGETESTLRMATTLVSSLGIMFVLTWIFGDTWTACALVLASSVHSSTADVEEPRTAWGADTVSGGGGATGATSGAAGATGAAGDAGGGAGACGAARTMGAGWAMWTQAAARMAAVASSAAAAMAWPRRRRKAPESSGSAMRRSMRS